MTYTKEYLKIFLSKFECCLIQRSILIDLVCLADQETQKNILELIKEIDKI